MSPETREALSNGEIAKDAIPEFYLDATVPDDNTEEIQKETYATSAEIESKPDDDDTTSETKSDVSNKHKEKDKKEKKEKKHKKHTKSSKKHSKSKSK